MSKKEDPSFQGEIRTIASDFPRKMTVFPAWPYISTIPSLKSGVSIRTELLFLEWAIIELFAKNVS